MFLKLSENQFMDAFNRSSSHCWNFSDTGLCALYDYFDEYPECAEAQANFDIWQICNHYKEYKTLADIQAFYENPNIKTVDDLRDYTSVIEFEDGIIIQNF